eukprot:g68502.t1
METSRGSPLTWRALIVGSALGVIMGTQNVYFGMRSGTSFGGSVVSSLLGFALVRLLIKAKWTSRPFSLQENVVLQTTAATGQGVIFSGGFSTYILAMSREVQAANPELGQPVQHVGYGLGLLWLLSTICLGFFAAQPMRRELVERHNYPWPSARATALVLQSLHISPSGAADTSARKRSKAQYETEKTVQYLLQVMGFAIAFQWFKWFYGSGMEAWPIFGGAAAKFLWTYDWSTAYVGSGMLLDQKAAFSLLAGSVVMFGFVSPLASRLSCFQDTPCTVGFDGLKAYWFLPMLAVTLVDSAYQLMKLLLVSTICRQRSPWRDTDSPLLAIPQRSPTPSVMEVSLDQPSDTGQTATDDVATTEEKEERNTYKTQARFRSDSKTSADMQAESSSSSSSSSPSSSPSSSSSSSSSPFFSSASPFFSHPFRSDQQVEVSDLEIKSPTTNPNMAHIHPQKRFRPTKLWGARRSGPQGAVLPRENSPSAEGKQEGREEEEEQEQEEEEEIEAGGQEEEARTSMKDFEGFIAMTERDRNRGRDPSEGASASSSSSHSAYSASALEDNDVPTWLYGGGYVLNSLLVLCVVPPLLHVPWYMCLMTLLVGPMMGYGVNLGAAVTDIALVSAVGKFIIICFGAMLGRVRVSAVGKFIIICFGAWSQSMLGVLWLAGLGMVTVGSSNDLLTDYKVAHLTRTPARAMFKAQVFGALVSCIFMPLVYALFLHAFPITPHGNFSAPGAVALRAMAALFVNGFSALPPHVGAFVLVFSVLCLINNLATDLGPPHLNPWLPNSIAFAVGGYIAPSFGLNPALGFLIAAGWRRRDPAQAKRCVATLGAGLIAGEGIAATMQALLALAGVEPPPSMAISFGS